MEEEEEESDADVDDFLALTDKANDIDDIKVCKGHDDAERGGGHFVPRDLVKRGWGTG